MEEKSNKQLTHRPLFGRVLIKREVRNKTTGGIILPDNAAKRHAKYDGVIIALGETAGWVEIYKDGVLTPIRNINVGDRVLFGRHAGAWLDATYDAKTGEDKDDGTLFICQDSDLLTVIEEEK